MEQHAGASRWNRLHLARHDRRLGVVATGIAFNYLCEVVGDRDAPSYLKIGEYPLPAEKLRRLVAHVDELLFLEEGYPFVERLCVGIAGLGKKKVRGRLSGGVPRDGELTPDSVRVALGRERRLAMPAATDLPRRPPALCDGCGHADTYRALNAALGADRQRGAVFGDIGCYTLGAYPPHAAIDACLDMGASIGMAAGAADAGMRPVACVIGDSTFVHSGMTPLIGAARRNCPITVLILDNAAVAMTGYQETMATGERLDRLVAGLGVDPSHTFVIRPHPADHAANVRRLREELRYEGLSVMIARRPCVRLRRRGAAATDGNGEPAA